MESIFIKNISSYQITHLSYKIIENFKENVKIIHDDLN